MQETTPTTIKRMMAGNRIFVPSYQRAYSWDTPKDGSSARTQVDVFLSDLEEYKNSGTDSPYYFGHFLFEKINDEVFNVVDGQQRLTTIVIFLSVLFQEIEEIRKNAGKGLEDDEKDLKENMIKLRGTYRFETVQYDQYFFSRYVIDRTKKDRSNLSTISARRIADAYDFFKEKLSNQTEDYLTSFLSIISKASCTTHIVKNESEAIQMFIFQNNRGKLPSNLEIVKAKFMYNVHLYGSDQKDDLIKVLKESFEEIYKSIAKIESHIDEDDILLYTLRVYFKSLWESNSLQRIDEKLSEPNPIEFINLFTQSLSDSFTHLSTFFDKDEKASYPIHSLVTLGGLAVAMPFIIKGYTFALPMKDKEDLCSSLEKIVVRHRLIGTRADITSRINDVFKEFTEENKDINPIIERVKMLQSTTDFLWAFWNNGKLEESIQGKIHPRIARFLLWKYENHLKSQGKAGYNPQRYEDIENPELEHIAPSTEPKKPHGYDDYDDDFKNLYIDCLGNYLLLSKRHNASIRNISFPEKHDDYTILAQQREIRALVPDPLKGKWTRVLIQQRKEKLYDHKIRLDL